MVPVPLGWDAPRFVEETVTGVPSGALDPAIETLTPVNEVWSADAEPELIVVVTTAWVTLKVDVTDVTAVRVVSVVEVGCAVVVAEAVDTVVGWTTVVDWVMVVGRVVVVGWVGVTVVGWVVVVAWATVVVEVTVADWTVVTGCVVVSI